MQVTSYIPTGKPGFPLARAGNPTWMCLESRQAWMAFDGNGCGPVATVWRIAFFGHFLPALW